MLIGVLSLVVRFGLWVFFRRIDISGRDCVPRGRPLIFVANHPNVMLDSLILGVYAPGGTPRFLGKSTLFRKRLYAFILRWLGVIQVSRTMDSDARMSRNQDMLRQARDTLLNGHALALFPEGLSHPARKVRALKPGAARIALRAEDETDGRACVHIVPVGLTYSDPGSFRSEVSVHFGTPIDVSTFLPGYRTNHHEGSRQLTEAIHAGLVSLTLHVEDPDLESVIRDLADTYGGEVAKALPDAEGMSRSLRAGQEIIQAVDYFTQHEPGLVESLAARLRLHHRRLRRLRVDPQSLVARRGGLSWFRWLVGLLLSPIAAYGFLNNALPYFLPRFFVRPYQQEPETVGSVKLAVGAVAFPLYYAVRTAIVYVLWGPSSAVLYGLTLPLSGLFTLYYKEHILEGLPLWRGMVVPRKRGYYLRRLSEERTQLIRDLDTVKARYIAAQEK